MITDKMDLHTHTVASGHAYNTRNEMIAAAVEKGLEILAITEHAPAMPGSCQQIYFSNYKVLPRRHGDLTVLYGTELNILDYVGHVDLPEEILKESDERVPKLDTVVTNTKYRTDYKLKCEVLRNCGFRCEIDDKHFSFLNNEGVMYVEGHHLVPMSFQKSFGDINIDCRDNIICLCPNCHKMIHYGGDLVKEELLEKLFMKVKDRSFFVDNAINVDRLKKFYNLEK